METASAIHVPVLRLGRPYRSLDVVEIAGPVGAPSATVSQANAALIRRDRAKLTEARSELSRLRTKDVLAICADAAERFTRGTLPLGEAGDGALSPDDYVTRLSIATGLPHALCRRNMDKIHAMLARMSEVLRGLTRGLPDAVLDDGRGEQAGIPLGYRAITDALGVILPSNSPGVNSLWLPAVALRIPVVCKPGRADPFTPNRIAQALFAAGLPRCAISVYPTDHLGAEAVLEGCGRSLLFGDASTTSRHASDPRIEIHGPGYSKVVIGSDLAGQVATSPALLDVLVASIAENGGRSCVNASTIVTASHGDAIASALAHRLAAIVPRAPDDPAAGLAAFTDCDLAARIDAIVEKGLAVPGATDLVSAIRKTPRLARAFGLAYLQPTLVRCASFDHPLACREFLFPWASVVEMNERDIAARIGPSLVVTALTRDAALIAALQNSPSIERLNVGPVPTSRVRWDQPHEGNLFELLYRRRAVESAPFSTENTP